MEVSRVDPSYIIICRQLPAPLSFNQYAVPIPDAPQVAAYRLNALDFEKDSDAHMRVVAAGSNLRARNYSIKEEDLHTSRYVSCLYWLLTPLS